MRNQISAKAIDSSLRAELVFCKFLSANDSGETGGHQSGILISKSAKEMLFAENEIRDNHILKRTVKIKWQDDFYTNSCFTWYESKNELRITRFGKGFPLLNAEYTGALFILTRFSAEDYEGFVLNTEEEIQAFLDTFGLTPAETNCLVDTNPLNMEILEQQRIDAFVNQLQDDFPSSKEMSLASRTIHFEIQIGHRKLIRTDPDRILLEWTDMEYRLFRSVEQSLYGNLISSGFSSVEEFVALAKTVLNRRKTRAGISLEQHLAAIFDGNGIQYTAQGITEGNKKPDFVFPSIEAYHDMNFSIEKICTLAAKTTCKDRWRQVLNEADRLRDQNKYLCTMQQGISTAQMDEMQSERVVLVVPKPFISSYPADRRDRIWTLGQFIDYIKVMEELP